MRITVIGAGAMGASHGVLLAGSGHEVRLVDGWVEHVDAMRRDGVRVEGVRGEVAAELPVSTTVDAPGWADVVIFFVDCNGTADAAPMAAEALAPDGFAVTFQNGIGNVERLEAAVGEGRVLGGSSMSSAARRAPGRVALTHLGPMSIGELDGADTERLERLAGALEGAGFEVKREPDIMATIWNKFVLNCAINPLCATSGLRAGDISRLPELDALQDRVIDEALAVVEAKGIVLPDPDLRGAIKKQCTLKFNKPSMLQHVEAGARTEIDAINGALVREGRALGVPTPYNEAVVALLKGRERARRREVHEPDIDYEAWEAAARRGEL